MWSLLQRVRTGHLKGIGLIMGFSLVDYTCHLAGDTIKKCGHLANFHWATNLSVITKVPYRENLIALILVLGFR